jgi:hypothetical protein
LSSDRLLAFGGSVLGAGATLAVGWLVYALQSHTSFWAWPGTLGVVTSACGALMLIVGFVMPKDELPVRQVQRSGNNSVNFQAGGDIDLHRGNSQE